MVLSPGVTGQRRKPAGGRRNVRGALSYTHPRTGGIPRPACFRKAGVLRGESREHGRSRLCSFTSICPRSSELAPVTPRATLPSNSFNCVALRHACGGVSPSAFPPPLHFISGELHPLTAAATGSR